MTAPLHPHLVVPNREPMQSLNRADLLAQITALRDSTEDVFLATGSQLIEVAGLLDAAKRAALTLSDFAQGDLIDRLGNEVERQSQGFAALATEIAETNRALLAITAALAGLGHELKDVELSVVTMRMVVLNARIALASMGVVDKKLLNFAVSGQALVSDIYDLLLRFKQSRAVILTSVELIGSLVRAISAALSTNLSPAFQGLQGDLNSFGQGVRSVTAQGADLLHSPQSILDATARAVSGLQIGDSTRQQLDHIAFILAHPDANDPALRALADALLQDVARGHDAKLGQLRDSVSQMTTGLTRLVQTHLAGFFNTPGEAAGVEKLDEDRNQLTQAIAILHPMQEQTRVLARAIAEEFATFRGLITWGEDVQDGMSLLGINAVLSCARLGQDGAALKLIAEQLQSVSQGVGTRFASIRSALDTISTLGSEIIANTDRLMRHMIDMPERLIAQIDPMLREIIDNLDPLQDAVALLRTRVSRLTFDFAPAQRHSRALAELASQTQSSLGPVGSDALSDASLAQIYAIFTIETERDLFRAVMPDRAEAVVAAVFTEPKAEMDDLFFI